jgi:hypothetical protein
MHERMRVKNDNYRICAFLNIHMNQSTSIELVTTQALGTHHTEIISSNSTENYNVRYLRYIIDRFTKEAFPDFVVFLRENPEEFATMSKETIIKTLNEEPCVLFDRTQWLRAFKCGPDGAPHHPGLDVGEWYLKLAIGAAVPQAFEFVPGGQFMVSGAKIATRSKAFFEKVLDAVESEKMSVYVLERLWLYIFNIV